MHLDSGVKVDLIIRKSSEFRQVEFARRQPVAIAGVRTWIVSREDLILSKLVWALESNSELQRRDIHQLLAGAIDLDHIHKMGAATGCRELAQRADAMNDSSAEISKLVSERHRAMTPAERWLAASSMFQTARKIVE